MLMTSSLIIYICDELDEMQTFSYLGYIVSLAHQEVDEHAGEGLIIRPADCLNGQLYRLTVLSAALHKMLQRLQ